MALGVLLLPLPGPGWLVIFVGLGVLASEFTWARRLLDYVRDRVEAWTGWIARRGLAVRVALGGVGVAVVAAALFGYVAWRGVPSWIPWIG